MKKALLLASMLLALTSSVALAEGVNLAWGTVCWTESDMNPVTTFACNVNTSAGNRKITVSYMLDTVIPDLVGVEWEIYGQSSEPALPDYWKLGAAPDCRAGRATFSSDFTGVETETCVDWTGGQGFNAPNYTWVGNTVKITLGTAIDAGFPYEALPGQEYYGGSVSFLNSKTVGTGACLGCQFPMGFQMVLFTAAALSGFRDDITAPMENNTLFWQDMVVPVEKTSWGQVKSLYR